MPADCQLIFVRESNMIPLSPSTRATWRVLWMSLLAAVGAASAAGQEAPSPSPPASTTGPMNWTVEQDHQNMMDQLGIKALRPGPSGNENAPNHANYDESKANPFPDLPDVLTLRTGKRVTTAAMWWNQRRPEIVEDFEREVLGRVPKNVPKITWTVTNTVNAMSGSRAVIGQQLTGHVDNSSYPQISVDIQMILVRPADATGPVPVMMMFGRGGLPQATGAGAGPPPTAGGGPP